MRLRSRIHAAALVAGVAALGAAAAWQAGAWTRPPPAEHRITISARQYAYEPPRLHVTEGDTVRLRLVSKDVIHGFYLEGHDINAEIRPQQKTFTVSHPESGRPTEVVEELTLVAARRGKFRYRCSHTCGTLHPFMTGELIVGPNTPLHVGVGAVIGLFVGMLIVLGRSSVQDKSLGKLLQEQGR